MTQPNERKIRLGQYTIKPGLAFGGLDQVISDNKVKEAGYEYLLAHADDGVIWGKIDAQKKLKTSHDVFPSISPPLQAITLQQLRLFGEQGELHVWRTEPEKFQGRIITDSVDDIEGKYFEESQILWGNELVDQQQGFTLVKEGQRGLYHAFPMGKSQVEAAHFLRKVKDKEHCQKYHPLRLKVRHYLTCDEVGQARVFVSRLVGVSVDEGGQG